MNVPAKFRKYLIKFRNRNYMLPVETGRWRPIPLQNRKFHLCHLDIGDEYHYVLTCNYLNNLRKHYVDRKFFVRPNAIKFSMLRKLCSFIKSIFESL